MSTKKISYDNILKILEHKKENVFKLIAENLDLQLFNEDSCITISGQIFVIDIYMEEHKIKDIKSENKDEKENSISGNQKNTLIFKKAELTLDNNGMTSHFQYIMYYFNICLAKLDMKTFYMLLNFLKNFDSLKEDSKDNDSELKTDIKFVRDENNSLLFCSCLLTDNNYCINKSFKEVFKLGPNYNIFTHRSEHLIKHKNHLFQFPIVKNKLRFFSRAKLDFNEKNLKNINEKIESNFLFYRILDTVSGKVEFDDRNTTINIFLEMIKIKIDIDLNVFFIYETEEIRNSEMSYMVKRGISVDECLEFLMINETGASKNIPVLSNTNDTIYYRMQ